MTTTLDPTFGKRLRMPPHPHSVAGTLPVLCFGDLRRAATATLGINPSVLEFARVLPSGTLLELDGTKRRFETLSSLGVSRREDLSDAQCCKAIDTMRAYFQPGRPTYWGWFRHIENLLNAVVNGNLKGTHLGQE